MRTVGDTGDIRLRLSPCNLRRRPWETSRGFPPLGGNPCRPSLGALGRPRSLWAASDPQAAATPRPPIPRACARAHRAPSLYPRAPAMARGARTRAGACRGRAGGAGRACEGLGGGGSARRGYQTANSSSAGTFPGQREGAFLAERMKRLVLSDAANVPRRRRGADLGAAELGGLGYETPGRA
jgi:hypothetical protein